MRKLYVTVWQRLGQLCWLICLMALLNPASSAHARSSAALKTVQWVYDGDTLQIAGIGTVRLIGIDCPEKQTSDRDYAFRRLGGASSRQLRSIAKSTLSRVIALCKGQSVRLEFDGERTDRYQRTLAYVWLEDGRMLNRLLLEEGRAIVYRRFDFKHKQDFLKVEETARRQRVGLWE